MKGIVFADVTVSVGFVSLFFFFVCFIEDRVVRKAKAVLIAEQSVQGYRIIQVSIFHPKRFFC